MTKTPVSRRAPPARWAVAALVLSAAFAALSIALIATGYGPV
jgi:hypothetical protein